MKKVLFLLLNVLVSVFFVWLATRGIDWTQLGSSLTSISLTLVIFSVIINQFSLWLRAWRWKFLLAPLKDVPTLSLFSNVSIGFMINNILPFRLGEIARGYILKKEHQISFTASMATVVVERVIDVISLLTVFGVLVIIFPFPEWIKTAGMVVGAIDLAAIIFMILLVKNTEATCRLVQSMISVFPDSLKQRVDRLLRSFVSGITFTHALGTTVVIAMLSFLIWAVYTVSIWIMFKACNAPELATLDLIDATIVMTFSSFAVMIPAAPGYVGTFHEVVKQSLMMFRVDREVALGFAIVIHAFNYAAQIVIGVGYWIKTNFSLKEALSNVHEEK
ncbi:MAG TPA: lysylphosphatidylglycerol synthase transmembrane domain-containing protein [bacterium]|nr:lysylphosphatidylglycerol synthase transmembrane domain-containing protein [bacterium]HNH32236.1 lysylphosphatidylglycerol synthase transmembrane domain-containing protein [bacterium]